MHRTALLLAALPLAASALGPAAAGDAYTTRYETRPVYGAVVTVEHGVRVYRPIPPTRYLIVDPRGSRARATAGSADDYGVNVMGPPRPGPSFD
jgi:hypothetical protein